jgi:hypothetical protein
MASDIIWKSGSLGKGKITPEGFENSACKEFLLNQAEAIPKDIILTFEEMSNSTRHPPPKRYDHLEYELVLERKYLILLMESLKEARKMKISKNSRSVSIEEVLYTDILNAIDSLRNKYIWVTDFEQNIIEFLPNYGYRDHGIESKLHKFLSGKCSYIWLQGHGVEGMATYRKKLDKLSKSRIQIIDTALEQIIPLLQ